MFIFTLTKFLGKNICAVWMMCYLMPEMVFNIGLKHTLSKINSNAFICSEVLKHKPVRAINCLRICS